MRAANLLVASLLATLVLAASLLRVDTVVEATGRLAADRPAIVLQPMERAIVRDLKVKAGDVVRKGQVLATFDPTFSQADLEALTARSRLLSATVRRLEAELGDAPPRRTARPSRRRPRRRPSTGNAGRSTRPACSPSTRRSGGARPTSGPPARTAPSWSGSSRWRATSRRCTASCSRTAPARGCSTSRPRPPPCGPSARPGTPTTGWRCCSTTSRRGGRSAPPSPTSGAATCWGSWRTAATPSPRPRTRWPRRPACATSWWWPRPRTGWCWASPRARPARCCARPSRWSGCCRWTPRSSPTSRSIHGTSATSARATRSR